MAQQAQPVSDPAQSPKRIRGAVVRFAGDSGDGMQVTGSQFTVAAALAGNDLATFPDFPAEIRAPAGTTYGVSGFQINFAAEEVYTPGDAPDVLVAMNPAALKTNVRDLKRGGLLIVNSGAFTTQNLKKAGYAENPLENNSLDGFSVLSIDISKNTLSAVKETGVSTKEANRCQELLDLGSHVLDLRPRHEPPPSSGSSASSAKSPELPGQHHGPQEPATRTAKPPRSPTSDTKYPPRRSPRARTATSAETSHWHSGSSSQRSSRKHRSCSARTRSPRRATSSTSSAATSTSA